MSKMEYCNAGTTYPLLSSTKNTNYLPCFLLQLWIYPQEYLQLQPCLFLLLFFVFFFLSWTALYVLEFNCLAAFYVYQLPGLKSQLSFSVRYRETVDFGIKPLSSKSEHVSLGNSECMVCRQRKSELSELGSLGGQRLYKLLSVYVCTVHSNLTFRRARLVCAQWRHERGLWGRARISSWSPPPSPTHSLISQNSVHLAKKSKDGWFDLKVALFQKPTVFPHGTEVTTGF